MAIRFASEIWHADVCLAISKIYLGETCLEYQIGYEVFKPLRLHLGAGPGKKFFRQRTPPQVFARDAPVDLIGQS